MAPNDFDQQDNNPTQPNPELQPEAETNVQTEVPATSSNAAAVDSGPFPSQEPDNTPPTPSPATGDSNNDETDRQDSESLNDADASADEDDEGPSLFTDLAWNKSDDPRTFIWASLLLSLPENNERLLPRETYKSWRGANLKFRKIERGACTTFTIEVIIEHPSAANRIPLHTAALEWYFGGTFQNQDQIKDVEVTHQVIEQASETDETTTNEQASETDETTANEQASQIDETTADEQASEIDETTAHEQASETDETTPHTQNPHAPGTTVAHGNPTTSHFDLSWYSSGAITRGLDVQHDEYTVEARELLAALQTLRGAGRVCFRLPVGGRGQLSKDEIARILAPWVPDTFVDPPVLRNHLQAFLRRSGRPQVQFNQMKFPSVLLKAEYEPVILRGSNTFTDPQEAEIKLGYGAHWDYEYQQGALRQLSKGEHSVGLIRLDPKTTLAKILVERDVGAADDGTPLGRISEGTLLDIEMRVAGIGRPLRYKVLVMENLFDIVEVTLVGVVIQQVDPDMPTSQYPAQPPMQTDCRITPVKNEAAVKRSISAIHELCRDVERDSDGRLRGTFERWFPVLLNQERNMGVMRPLEHLPAATIQEVVTQVRVSINNREQAEALEFINQLPGGVMLIHGPAGTGKTVLLAHLMSAYHRLGAHIILTAPRNIAANTLLNTFLALEPECDIVRVFRAVFEKEEQRDPGQKERYELNTASVAAEVGLVHRFRQDQREKAFGLPQHSLTRKMMARAEDPVTPAMMVTYTPEEGEEENIELWSALCEYIERLKEENFFDWEEAERDRYGALCRHGCAEAMKAAKVVVTTCNNVGDRIICTNFGHEADVIVGAVDEAALVPESDQWILMSKLGNHAKLQGVWMAGDHQQLRPSVFSIGARCNPFGPQLARPLFTRLMREGHRHIALTRSNRMSQVILRFPNKRSYLGTLKATTIANNRRVPEVFCRWSSGYFNDPRGNTQLMAIMVEESLQQVTGTSRCNYPNAAVVVNMVESARVAGVFQATETVILTPYLSQRRLIMRNLIELAKTAGLPISAYPEVATIDAFQSREAAWVILDSVVTGAAPKLGFVDDEGRMTVASTRPQLILTVVGSRDVMDITNQPSTNEKDGRKEKDGKKRKHKNRFFVNKRGERVSHDDAFLVEYLRHLNKVDLAIDQAGDITQLVPLPNDPPLSNAAPLDRPTLEDAIAASEDVPIPEGFTVSAGQGGQW